jgi:hypothetical protein
MQADAVPADFSADEVVMKKPAQRVPGGLCK